MKTTNKTKSFNKTKFFTYIVKLSILSIFALEFYKIYKNKTENVQVINENSKYCDYSKNICFWLHKYIDKISKVSLFGKKFSDYTQKLISEGHIEEKTFEIDEKKKFTFYFKCNERYLEYQDTFKSIFNQFYETLKELIIVDNFIPPDNACLTINLSEFEGDNDNLLPRDDSNYYYFNNNLLKLFFKDEVANIRGIHTPENFILDDSSPTVTCFLFRKICDISDFTLFPYVVFQSEVYAKIRYSYLFICDDRKNIIGYVTAILYIK